MRNQVKPANGVGREGRSSASPTRGWLRKAAGEEGSILVLTAISMTCLLGFLALATDVGILFLTRRNAQSAADAGALAGARELPYLSADGTTVAGTADAATAQSGFANGADGVTVSVSNGPADGPHSGDANYVEVIVQKNVPTYFMRVFGKDSVLVSARAVAGNGVAAPCMTSLDPNPPGGNGIYIQGNGTITGQNCALYSNSGLHAGGSSVVDASYVGIAGNYNSSGNGGGSISPAPQTTDVVNDPYAYTPEPVNPGGCTSAPSSGTLTANSDNATWTCYNGINVGSNNTLALDPGLYYINGDLNEQAGGTININTPNPTGSGVTLYVTGSISLGGNGSAYDLFPPDSGQYTGFVIFHSRTDNCSSYAYPDLNPTPNGLPSNQISLQGTTGVGTDLSGIFYAPCGNVSLQGTPTMDLSADFITATITIYGNGTINETAYQGPGSRKMIALVE